ncbi:hypothetical protein BTR34_05110 [Maribacter hydrothermalis]|nr:hypothetical protein BTR34_05110 [Maribacter hydrothermalis]
MIYRRRKLRIQGFQNHYLHDIPHLQVDLELFINKSTNNATVEYFNPKIKSFRAQYTEVRNIEFFLFGLINILA